MPVSSQFQRTFAAVRASVDIDLNSTPLYLLPPTATSTADDGDLWTPPLIATAARYVHCWAWRTGSGQ
jgi:hypothetical protein